MFWRLGLGHVGKTAYECSRFDDAKFASVTKSAVAQTEAGGGALPSSLSVSGPADQDASPPSSAVGDPAAAVVDEGRKASLTKEAFKVVGLPWVDRAPLQDIKALGQADIESIRAIFRGSPNQFWPQALQTLAIVGDAEDVKLIQQALNLPMPAVAPGESSGDSIQRFRVLLQTKLLAPKALGILANRTQSSAAVETLTHVANLDIARELVGQSSANSLSKNAINGLSIANTPAANAFINANLGAKFAVESGAPPVTAHVKVAPFAPEELEGLTKSHEQVRDLGVESMFK